MTRRQLCALVVALAAAALVSEPAFSAKAGSDPWAAAAAELTMPILKPSSTPGMTLKSVDPQKVDCGPIQEQLIARYGGGPNGRRLKVLEGKPQFCGDIGDAPLIAQLRVHGERALLYEYCEGLGCKRATNRFLLTWKERGITVTLINRGTPRSGLLAIARGMVLVPA